MQPRIAIEKHKSPVGASAERRGYQSPPPPPLEDSIEHGHMLMKSLFITQEDSLSDCVPRLTCGGKRRGDLCEFSIFPFAFIGLCHHGGVCFAFRFSIHAASNGVSLFSGNMDEIWKRSSHYGEEE
jgi:hypothetical protein